MKATADTRADLPSDMIARFQVLSAMSATGTISPRTVRDLSLNEDIRAIDDLNQEKDKEEQEAMRQQALQEQMQLQQQQAAPRIPSLGGAGATAPLLQDEQRAITEQGRNEITAASQDLVQQQRL
jgi:MoxR-like ATPase